MPVSPSNRRNSDVSSNYNEPIEKDAALDSPKF